VQYELVNGRLWDERRQLQNGVGRGGRDELTMAEMRGRARQLWVSLGRA
jgi:hypothetical protein